MSRFARIVEDPEYLDEEAFPESEWDQAFPRPTISPWSDIALDRLVRDLGLNQVPELF
jgi:hypothetical protein